MNNDVKLLWVIHINTRSRRRGLVVTFYASLVLGCLFSLLIHSATSGLTGVYAGMVVSSLLLAASYGTLVHLLQDYGLVGSHTPHTSRDERQEQVRHASYVRAYWILMALVCVTSAVFLSSSASGFLHLALAIVGKPLVPVAAIVLAVSLPSSVIAWTEPT